MRGVQARVVLSLLMIAAGVLFLFQNLGFLEGAGAIFWALAFAVAGAAFLYIYLSDRVNWWAIIPGFTLLGIGGLIAVEKFIPQYGDTLGVPLLMGCFSLSFWIIYLTNHERWWAIIPGGVLLTIGVFVGLESLIKGVELVGIFFMGLGLTFVALALLPTPEGPLRWAFIPAAVLLMMGVLFTATAFSIFKFVGPAGVILIGLFLIYRTLRPKEQI